MSVRLSVLLSIRLSQVGIVSKGPDESSCVLAWGLPSTYPRLCYKEIWVGPSPKIRVLLSKTLSQTLDFATASRSLCQQHSSSSSSTVEFVSDTYMYTTVDESWLFTTSRSTVTLNSITAIFCGFIVQLVYTLDSILTDSVSRRPSAVVGHLVKRAFYFSFYWTPVSGHFPSDSSEHCILYVRCC